MVYKSHWFLGDEPLDHYAYNVEKRSGAWRIPGRRGENYEVPGRSGAIHNPSKPFEQSLIPLSMWAQGAEYDGSIPVSESEALKCRNNLDELSRLFGYRGLKELVRADTPGYGRINMIPNPSMEEEGEKIVLRENVIGNPSGEVSDGKIIVRRNFADNPGMEQASAEQAFRTNWVRNSRFANESEPIITLRNYVQNPSVEAGTKFWRAQFNCKIATSRKVRVGGTWPIQGQQSLRMVAIGSGNAAVEAHTIPDIDPTKDWTFSGSVWQRCERAVTCRMFVRWFNKNGVFISATSNVDVVVPIEGTTRLNQTILAASIPAAAKQASIRFVLVGAVQDDVMYIDAAMANGVATLKPYFDGDTDEEDGIRYRWRGTASRSVSIAYRVPPKGWYSPVATASCTTARARRGVQSCKVEIGTATAVNDVILRQTVGGGCNINEDTWLSGLVYVRRQDLDDAAATRTVKLNLQCWNSNGDYLGNVLDGPGGAAKVATTLTIMPAQWQPVEIEACYTRPDTDKVILAIQCGEIWSSGEIIYVDTALVEDSKKIDEFFDGNTDDEDTFHFSWTDDPHWSASEQRGRHVIGWFVDQARPQFRTADGYIREFAMRLEPNRSPDAADRPSVSSLALDLRPGRKHRLSAWVNLSRSHSIKLGISYNDGESWTYGGAAVPAVATWQRLNFGFTVPADSDPEQTLIRVESDAAPVDGDFILIDSVLFEPAQNLRPYFDGESGARCRWLDDPERSVSVRELDRPNGWSGWGDAFPVVRRIKATASQGSYVVRSLASQDGEMGVTFAQDGIDSDLDYSFGIDLKPSVTRNGYAAIVWLNEEGDQVGISQSTTTSLSSAAFTRKTVSAASPPAGATIGVPIAVVVGGLADEHLDADGAIFGFGAATDYKDGNSGSGWRWTGKKGFSESEQIGVGLDFWGSNNGTFARNATWSTTRDHNGTYTVTNGGPACYVYATSTGKDDERRFALKPNSIEPFITFAVDARAVTVGAQFEARLLLSRWRAQGWQQSTAPANPTSGKVIVGAGGDARLVVTVDTSEFDLGDATHFRPEVYVFDAAGGDADTGQVIRLDSASLSRDDVSVYMDGTGEYVIWTGTPDNSASKRIGPARKIKVERLAAIEPDSQDSAELAFFQVVLNAPNVFWEDTVEKTQKLALPRRGGVLMFDKLEGCTAPIEDAVITINGPLNDITITDIGTGEWLRIDLRLKQDQSVVIDNDQWEVRRGNGKMVFGAMRHSGDSVLLPITVPHDKTIPRLRIDADAIGRGAWVRVVARRKYLIA